MAWLCAVLGFMMTGLAVFRVWKGLGRFSSYRAAHRALEEELMRHARLCVHCRYDVRANSGRCPECGQPVQAVPPDL